MFLKFKIQFADEKAYTHWQVFSQQNRSAFWFGMIDQIDPSNIQVEFDDPKVSVIEPNRSDIVRGRLEKKLLTDGYDIIAVDKA